MRRIFCCFVTSLMIFATACGSNEASKEVPKETKPQMPSDDALAFKYGIRYADTCIWAALGDADKQNEDFKKANILAEALGMPSPTAPTKENAIELMSGQSIADELKTKKGEKVAALFSLGAQIKVGLFGSSIGGDTSAVVTKIESYAKASGVPESVWKADIDAMKVSPKGTFDKLTRSVSGFLEK